MPSLNKEKMTLHVRNTWMKRFYHDLPLDSGVENVKLEFLVNSVYLENLAICDFPLRISEAPLRGIIAVIYVRMGLNLEE